MRKTKNIFLMIVVCAMLLTGCSLPGLSGPSKDTVKIGTLNTSESQIMGQIVKQLIEHHTDAKIAMVNNLGSSIVQHQAMVNGDVNITATRYTGTDLSGALGMEPINDPDEALRIVQEEFDKRFDQTWFDSYGFANSYAFTVRNEVAEEHGLEKVSDVESIADELRFGVDNSWLKRKGDGYEGFTEAYGFEFKEAFPMQIGLVYQAAESGKMDIVLAYTTDGRIKAFDLKVLEDDLNFFPPYDTSIVASNDILDRHPELYDILDELSGQIDTELMQEMNYAADGQMKEPATIATEYLKSVNYFE